MKASSIQDTPASGDICPLCQGKDPPIHKTKILPTVLDPDYVTNEPGVKWTTGFWVCAGCLGKRTRTAYTERVLTGEFNPLLPANQVIVWDEPNCKS